MVGLPLLFAFTAGMVATVNPCGFAMLPAYVSMMLTGEAAPDRAAGVRHGLRVGGWVTAGFLAVFGAVGLITSLISQWLLTVIPWVAVGIGAVLVVFGVAILWGLHLRIPALDMRFGKDGSRRSMVVFGAAYGAASLSCTLPVFLAVAAAALASPTFLAGWLVFGAYAIGMGIVLMGLAVALSSSRDFVVARLRRVMPYVERIGGWLLIASGLYIVYYWVANLTVPITDSNSPWLVPGRFVERVSAWFTNSIASSPLTWVVALVGIVVAVAAFEMRRQRRVGSDLIRRG